MPEKLAFNVVGRMVRVKDENRDKFICRVELTRPTEFDSDVYWFTEKEVESFRKVDGEYEDLVPGSYREYKLGRFNGIIAKLQIWKRDIKKIEITNTEGEKEEIDFVLPDIGTGNTWVECVVYIPTSILAKGKARAEIGMKKVVFKKKDS